MNPNAKASILLSLLLLFDCSRLTVVAQGSHKVDDHNALEIVSQYLSVKSTGDAALIIASGIAIAIVVVAVGVAVGAGVVAYRYVYVPVKDAWHTLGNYQQAWQYIQKKLF